MDKLKDLGDDMLNQVLRSDKNAMKQILEDLKKQGQISENFEIPKDHLDYNEKDKEKCPFYQISMQNQLDPNQLKQQQEDIKLNIQQQKPQQQQNLSEQEKQIERVKKSKKKGKGGCPFLQTSKKKLNPGLFIMDEGYDTKFISPMTYLIEFKGILPSQGKLEKRKLYESYPIYLKHTLYYDDEDMKKIRTLEYSHRFFIYEQIREKSNKEYNKDNLKEAIQLLERALSLFKWLEMVDDDEDDDMMGLFGMSKQDREKLREKQKQIKEMIQKQKNQQGEEVINIDSSTTSDAETIQNKNNEKEEEKEQEKTEEQKKIEEELKQHKEEAKQIRKKYKNYIQTYTDENIKLFDCKNISDDHERDMVNSIMITIYLNLSVCYMKLKHFSVANQAIKDAMDINDKNSQTYYRRSQNLSANKEASLEDLMQAKKDIEAALMLKRVEKIFQAEVAVLKMLNLENAQQAYEDQAHYVEKRIKQRQNEEQEIVETVMARCKQIQNFEEELLKEGKTPQDYSEESQKMFKDEMNDQYNIALEIIDKYNRVIEFYQENKKNEQVDQAKKELQYAKSILVQMNMYKTLDFKNYKQNSIIMKVLEEIELDLTNEKILQRLDRIKLRQMQEIFENAKWNFQIFQYATEQYFQRKTERQKKQEQQQKKEQQQDIKETNNATILENIFQSTFKQKASLIILLFLLILFYHFFIGNNFVGYKDLFKVKN